MTVYTLAAERAGWTGLWEHARMRASVAVVHSVVGRLEPGDALEGEHRRLVLDWLGGTDDVFRRVKPATPDRHLVSYVVPVDPRDGAILLVDHVNAGLWLPPGGHVEPDEDPWLTAVREVGEELGLDGTGVPEEPVFLTVTRTVGIDSGHTDVSLWYVLPCDRAQKLAVDEGEFRGVRWWARDELVAADPDRFDPHFRRFLRRISD
ncbi:DNA mismatch repair protein MutT [Paractinoplanes abujensis]|uniref:8-oxo-dGTP pyrophosphatase MutT (NUDIX family) n=1 Tax=Paractinoplanes abujensis TaxID=882441 RepID=A0A7W7CTR4_9ACTN|nr:NUDIX domain-containing protein [Actinoplanes abujensis]MBB4694517.1 8-oxo-dGTP pyrophosphatase MutT (NUDIX family) [Actinoplanes abujensis]GID20270.1 DNA mismatch repair protein MutT [Actinoplanes abujensis]